ncbi:hypothetical protein, partial [Kamptonema formosum]|uniref:hypothetical protein n=1 Tax=Kamptonema formosum TaxID=331992 RepID=UPI001E4422B5
MGTPRQALVTKLYIYTGSPTFPPKTAAAPEPDALSNFLYLIVQLGVALTSRVQSRLLPCDYLGKSQPSSGVLLLFDETDVIFNSSFYLVRDFLVDFA